MLSFQPVMLDGEHGDSEAVLAFREGRLTAVLSHLSAIHGELEGHWFLEASFDEHDFAAKRTFDSLSAFEKCLMAMRE